MMKNLAALSLIVILCLIAACASTGGGRNIEGTVPVDTAQAEIPENRLLNVSIEVFDPGTLPENEKQANGLSMDIRNAEARYMPEQLRVTMENTGYWGAVRVVPRGLTTSELLVSGTILQSTGLQLDLEITARDASGHAWFTREYRAGVEAGYYQLPQRSADAFQPLYNTIANDLSHYQKQLTSEDIAKIRHISELRFAMDIAPEAFSGYLQVDKKGEYTVNRLPSLDDPMFGRVQAILQRDLLMIDTLDGHFDNFYREMEQPYLEWRKARSAEAEKQRKLEKAALNRTILGIASIVGAVFIGVASPDYNAGVDTLTDVMVLGGAAAIKSGADKRSEASIHRQSIEELGNSFSSETKPLVIEVEGNTIELTGSAESQYEQWRLLMGQIYAGETGLSGTPR